MPSRMPSVLIWMFVLGLSLLVGGMLSDVMGQSTVGGQVYAPAAQTTTGATIARIQREPAFNHSIQLVVTGTPSGCTYRLQGSNDGGTTWFSFGASDITCTSSTVAFVTGQGASRIRGNLLTLTGGSTPSVRMWYTGQ